MDGGRTDRAIGWSYFSDQSKWLMFFFDLSLVGVVMFCSFASFGALPILGYVIIPGLFPSVGEDVLFTAACVITGLVLFGMGCVKSIFR